jgi:hypothetical protein
MEPEEEMESGQLQALARVFEDQLVACLEECARGRRGLFSSFDHLGGEDGWPEAARLRELAMALQGIFAQSEEANPLADEFLDLCSIHGESNPGEARLARAFLGRIEKKQVGVQAPTERMETTERKLW